MQHESNCDMVELSLSKPLAKDTSILRIDSTEYPSLSLGISEATYSGLVKNNVSVYSVGGYYDHARASICS